MSSKLNKQYFDSKAQAVDHYEYLSSNEAIITATIAKVEDHFHAENNFTYKWLVIWVIEN